RGVTNLETEGIENVHLTGDVMYDAILWARTRAADHSTVLDDHDLTAGEYVLATVHRAGNTDDRERLAAIMRALGAADREVVLPIHPRTADCLETYGLRETVEQQLTVIEPQG